MFVVIGAMMVAMMLPSTWPMLRLYHRVVVFRGEPAASWLPWLAAAAFGRFGVGAYGGGLLIARLAMSSAAVSRSVPALAGAALIVAGVSAPAVEDGAHLRGGAARRAPSAPGHGGPPGGAAGGAIAITRSGLPLPFTIFSGAAMTMAPVGGS